MGINLQKGQREKIGAQRFIIGLGWEENKSGTGKAFDLDASAFIVGENQKLLSDQHFVFYNNKACPEGALTHSGDNTTGDAEGDDETIIVDLSKINSKATDIFIAVTIHEAQSSKQNFGQVRNSYVRILDASTDQELLKYELEEDFSTDTGVEFARIYKHNGEWKFQAVGTGVRGGLEELLVRYN